MGFQGSAKDKSPVSQDLRTNVKASWRRSPLALRKWLSHLSAAWGRQRPVQWWGKYGVPLPGAALPSPQSPRVTLTRILLAPCLLDSARHRGRIILTILTSENPTAARPQGRKLDFSRSHLLLPGRWKPFSSQILGKPITQQVNGIKRNWEDNLKRTFQETLSLDSGIWLHTNWWTQRPCFSQMQRFHPNDNIEVNLIISQRHDVWSENQNIHNSLVYLYRMWAITMTKTIATITMYFLCARHHTKNFHCANS